MWENAEVDIKTLFYKLIIMFLWGTNFLYQNATAHFKHLFPPVFISVNIEQAASMTVDVFMFPPRSLLNTYSELWVLELFTGLHLMGGCYTQISFHF